MDYRLYLLDGGKHFQAVIEISADDDGVAVSRALNLGKNQAVEFWQGARCVAKFGADGKPAEGGF